MKPQLAGEGGFWRGGMSEYLYDKRDDSGVIVSVRKYQSLLKRANLMPETGITLPTDILETLLGLAMRGHSLMMKAGEPVSLEQIEAIKVVDRELRQVREMGERRG